MACSLVASLHCKRAEERATGPKAGYGVVPTVQYCSSTGSTGQRLLGAVGRSLSLPSLPGCYLFVRYCRATFTVINDFPCAFPFIPIHSSWLRFPAVASLLCTVVLHR